METGRQEQPIRVYIGLGTNLGEREHNLDQALHLLGQAEGVKLVAASSRYVTRPWGKTEQPDFLNQVAAIETARPARELLQELLRIENEMGRVRTEKWGPRVIDLDLLLFGDQVIDEPELQVPHPFLTERDFVMIPLLEIDPGLILPDGRKLKKVFNNYDKSGRTGCVSKISVIQ